MRHEIVDFASLTPMRLSAILNERGILSHGTVQSVRTTHIHESPTAFVAFLQVCYSPDVPSNVPTHLVMKMYKPDVRRTWGTKEIIFYTALTAMVEPLPIVPCYDAFVDPQGTACYCLLADMTHTAASPPHHELPLITQLYLASTALAQLHAAFWNHQYIRGPLLDETRHMFSEDFTAHRQRYTELATRFHDRMPARWHTIFSSFIANAEQRLRTRLTTHPALTFWHSDTHLGNFLFTQTPTPAVYVIDFAIYRAWWGVRDIAFLLTFALEPVQRRSLEQPLLQHYLAQLQSYGVSMYSWEQCWEDYRWAVVANLRTPLGNRHRPNAWERLERAITAYEDLAGDEVLSGS